MVLQLMEMQVLLNLKIQWINEQQYKEDEGNTCSHHMMFEDIPFLSPRCPSKAL